MSDKLTDKLVGSGVKPELSPNPDGSGYKKQVEVSNLVSVESPEENVLYIVNGKQFKYLKSAIVEPATNKVIVPAGWVRVDNGPASYNKKGERGTPVNEVTSPREKATVIPELVNFIKGILIKGKTIEQLIEDSVDAIPSGDAEEGKALVSDGQGGSEWKMIIQDSGLIQLGEMTIEHEDADDENEEYNFAGFSKELTKIESEVKISDSGLCILMFNTTCVILPYIRGELGSILVPENRFVASVIYNDEGESMVSRGVLKISKLRPAGVSQNYGSINVEFDGATAKALFNGLTTPPTAVIRFLNF